MRQPPDSGRAEAAHLGPSNEFAAATTAAGPSALSVPDTCGAALDLLARGWQPVRLHGLRDDGRTCTCRLGAACKVAGKHPTDKGWQDAPMPTPEQVEGDWSGWREGCNVGVGTGERSGAWVLDVDPDHGGDATLAALVTGHGPLPVTYEVRTGGGGRHYYFAWPGFQVTNSAGRLGLGLDVRGNGGQAVAPPSVSAKGAYVVLHDAPVAAPPPWLLDRLRKPAAVVATGQRRRTGEPLRRVQAVVQVVMDAPEGARNTRLFWAACRMGEVVEHGGLTTDEARACLRLVGEAVGLDDDEVAATVTSGLRAAGAA